MSKKSGEIKFNSVRRETVKIGKRVQVAPFTTIGFPGFGFEKNEEGTDYKYPLQRKLHPKKVILEDDAEIGSSCCIDRGSWRDSIIGRGTKIDNLVHTGHNTQIGKHCLIACGVCIGGSCTIGDRVFIGMNATILQGLIIGDNATIGAGSVVTKDVPAGWTVIGNPARKLEK